jgi:2-polyprenyl-3-methyl-5-hydroxy-6-metoxy-1,4-benzoquinol methylase
MLHAGVVEHRPRPDGQTDDVTEQEGRPRTDVPDYAERLKTLEQARWKRWLDVQAPYRWNIRRLDLGRTLDVGCGLGRNLAHLGGAGVGVDHNAASVAVARERGLEAYTSEEFLAGPHAREGAFDSLLAAHVVEHMSEEDAVALLRTYLPFVRKDGKVVLITPQERGYATDATHVRFCGFAEVAALCETLDLTLQRQYSFPFPRAAGRVFPYNEFVSLARV